MSYPKQHSVLFICTGNSARSIMGEMAANLLTNEYFIGFSAGSNPTGIINPAALEIAKELGYPINKLKSKSINIFSEGNNNKFDYAITVCDNAKDACPVYTNCLNNLHWSYSDPADIVDFNERKQKLLEIYQDIGTRLNAILKKNVT